MTRITVFLLFLVAGCSGQGVQDSMRHSFGKVFKPNYSLEHFEAQCKSEPFMSYGACVRNKMTAAEPQWRSEPNADLDDLYLSWLEAAGHHIEDRTLSEPDARLGAAELRVRLTQLAAERKTMTEVQRQAALSRTLVGLALINASQPSPATPIVCNTSSLGGVTQTRCN